MGKKLLLVAMLGLASASASFCQDNGITKIDSLLNVLQTEVADSIKVNTLNELAYTFRSNNPDTALYFADRSLTLATKSNYQTGAVSAYLFKSIALKNIGNYEEALTCNTEALAICDQLLQLESVNENDADKNKILKLKSGVYSNTGNIYQNKGEFQEALINDFIALEINQELGDKLGTASLYNNIGNIYAGLGNYPAALQNLLAALKIKEEIGSKRSIANSYNNIGIIYWNQGDYAEALKFHAVALTIREEIGDKYGIASSYNNTSLVYESQRNYDLALQYNYKSLKISEEINDQEGIATSYNNIGNIYMHQGKYAEALKHHFIALKIEEEIGDKDGLSDSNISIGKIYMKQGKNDEASIHLNKGLSIAREIGSLEYIRDAYSNLSQLDSLDGNYKKALEHYKLYVNYKDSLFNEENTRKIVQSKMQYEFDKKETLAKAEQDKKDAEAKRARFQQYLIIAVLIFILLTVGGIATTQFRLNKQKKKANVLLRQQKQKLESTLSELKSTQAQLIQSEKMASLGELTAGIAHEIQNPLNFVNNFSEVNRELLAELKEEIEKGNLEEIKAIAGDLEQNEEKISHHGKRADGIVKSMLQHSRSSSGQKELTNLNTLADEYLRLAYHGLRAKDKSFNADFKLEADPDLPKINVVPQDIGRVLLNLINNAFFAVTGKAKMNPENYKPQVIVKTEYSPLEGGLRGVSSPTLSAQTRGVLIRVRDNGPGIPPEIKDKIFQPFFTTKPTGEGTGLGLSLSYDIITKGHGGEIKIISNENEGAEFIIFLPIS
ncbi:MAG TPA: tetratricopeptide repeat protein [Bacteroidales bacterium]|nr:tetratricopeptide repeat protein [Bacteroidales bacterium]